MSVSNSLRRFIQWLIGLGDRESEIPESERAYSAQLQQRAKLNDDEFYEAFYAETGIPKHIPIRLRTLLQKNIMGDDLSALHPNDNLALIYDGLDFADVLYRVGKEFELTIPLTVCKSKLHADGEIDGTFDSVVRYLNRATIKKTRKD